MCMFECVCAKDGVLFSISFLAMYMNICLNARGYRQQKVIE